MMDEAFWEKAAKGLPWFRFFRRQLLVERIDLKLLGTRLEADWLKVKASMHPGDQLWPFEFKVRSYLGLRRGYLVLRNGRPVNGIVVEVS